MDTDLINELETIALYQSESDRGAIRAAADRLKHLAASVAGLERSLADATANGTDLAARLEAQRHAAHRAAVRMPDLRADGGVEA